MPNKLNLYFDPSKLTGAVRMRLKDKTGTLQECLVIPIKNSRIRTTKAGNLGLSIDLVPNRAGKDDYGQTHWAAEARTKEERELNPDVKTLIIGNAREYDETSRSTAAAATATTSSTNTTADLTDPEYEDEIPF